MTKYPDKFRKYSYYSIIKVFYLFILLKMNLINYKLYTHPTEDKSYYDVTSNFKAHFQRKLKSIFMNFIIN